MSDTNFSGQSIAQLATGLREGRLKARDLAEAAIDAQTRLEPALNAYRDWNPDYTRAQADAADAAFAARFDLGVLQGLPVSAKDLYAVAGYETFAGSPHALPMFAAEGPVVRTLRRNLAVIPGKTHTVEWAFGGIGMNPHHGAPHNPWDARDHRAPGGSSSGAGVSLWQGSAVAALGSDTAGSVRIPASWTGTVGVKTTYGRWSLAGIAPLSPTLDTAGVLARSAEDAALAFAALDPQTDDPMAFLADCRRVEARRFTLGVCDWMFEGTSPGVAEAVQQALDALAAAGARVVKVEVPNLVELHELFRQGGIAGIEFAAFISRPEMAKWKAAVDPIVRSRFTAIESVPANEYIRRVTRIGEMAAEARPVFERVDAIVGPTIPITPPKLADLQSVEAYSSHNLQSLRNTSVGNILALSGVTLPVGLDAAGMPVGLQVLTPNGADQQALAMAVAFERVLGTPRDRLGVPAMVK
ncbi:MAG: amidase [Alphaproteobacteria bacterium]|nr:amidase [Alphaproteobacteria bacterium]MCB9928372.1 amidase [Alphaproteobacteria bacterium]